MTTTNQGNNCLMTGCNLKSDYGWFCRNHQLKRYVQYNDRKFEFGWYAFSVGVAIVVSALLYWNGRQ